MSGDNYYEVSVNPGTCSEERLLHMLTEACKHPAGSPERQKNLTKIIRSIKNKLWKENKPYYPDALQQTWVYFCQNICEGNTGRPYDPNRGSIVTWLNFYLKKRLHDFYINNHNEERVRITTLTRHFSSGETSQTVDPVENIPANPDVPSLLEEVRRWVETDPEGELHRIHITNHPQVTCQILILRRLPPETSWKTLATEFNLSISTLSSFYQRQCLPLLRKFGESQGYL